MFKLSLCRSLKVQLRNCGSRELRNSTVFQWQNRSLLFNTEKLYEMSKAVMEQLIAFFGYHFKGIN